MHPSHPERDIGAIYSVVLSLIKLSADREITTVKDC